ncbi:uncharacterized protein LOC115439719 [Manduca sexta]|uniref:uncharacterized protein LOC115439719 n=1 Tax=Manduca sexta TaxID=7130 RepID=UPI001890134B|nr:uncharacterized protein LOC115439719 [Manduca sexta]
MKMCITIVFILIFIRYNVCDESNESKYIDLLPDEEKEEFLQKIARRIFEEAEVKDDRYKQSREVADDQLNEHTEFVKKILREESANLKQHTDNEREKEDESEEAMRVKPLVKDKISDERTQDDNRYVDLTLRQGKRKKRRDSFDTNLEQNTEGLVNEDIKYDTEENKVIENGEEDSNLAKVQRDRNSKELVNRRDQSSFEDIQVKYVNRKNDVDNKNLDETVSSTNRPRITQMTNFDAESVENFSKEDTTPKHLKDNDDKPEGLEPTTTKSPVSEKVETSSRRFTESIYEPITRNGDELLKMKTTTEEIILTPTEKISTVKILSNFSNINTQKVNITKGVLRSETDNNSTIDNTGGEVYMTKFNMENTASQIYEYTTQRSYNNEKNSSLNNNSVTNGYPFDVEEQPIDLTIHNTVAYDTTKIIHNTESTNMLDTKVAIDTKEAKDFTSNNKVGHENTKIGDNAQPTNISLNTEEVTTHVYRTVNVVKPTELGYDLNKNETNTIIDENNIGSTTTKTTEGSASLNEVAGDVVRALRQRLLEHDEKPDSDESLVNEDKIKHEEPKNRNKQSYNVYELPPNEKPFVIKPEITKSKNQDQPHYVPIYNYSHDNAYFNALNHFGPILDASVEKGDSDIEFHGIEKDDVIQLSEESYGMPKENVDNRKFRFGNKESFGNPKRTHKIQKLMMPVVKQQEHHSEVLINPDDYLDTDYYFGRTYAQLRDGRYDRSKKLPDSHEETHPSLDTIKDHIRSVRKILFQNQIFGYIPPVNGSAGEVTPPEKPSKVTEAPPYDYLKRTNDRNNISVDYYFGRMKQDSEYKRKKKGTKVGYIRYNNYYEDLHVTKDTPEDLMRKVNVIKFGNKLFFRDDKKDFLRNKTKIFAQDESIEYYDTIKKVLKLTNEVDVFPTLEKMRRMNISYTRSRHVPKDLSIYLEVLDEILKTDIKPFIQYDWLGTTVEIQSALSRLIDLTEAVQNKIVIHPADLGLLKYVVYLFQTAKTMIYLKTKQDERDKLRMGVILPRNRKRKPMFLKEKGLLNRVWLFKRENMIANGVLNEFNRFLHDTRVALFDLHDAIKHISLITKYTDQAWFENLQRIYMKNDRKHLLELTLHLTATRLYGLIEESAVNGVEINTVDYIRNNDKHVERSIDEFIFVLRLLDEIKYL